MFWRKKEKETKVTKEKRVTQIVANPKDTHVGPFFAAQAPALNIITEYEDNSPVCQELRVSLSPHDWCKFEKQDFYSQLIEWVRSLENVETQDNTEDLIDLLD